MLFNYIIGVKIASNFIVKLADFKKETLKDRSFTDLHEYMMQNNLQTYEGAVFHFTLFKKRAFPIFTNVLSDAPNSRSIVVAKHKLKISKSLNDIKHVTAEPIDLETDFLKPRMFYSSPSPPPPAPPQPQQVVTKESNNIYPVVYLKHLNQETINKFQKKLKKN